MDEQREANRDRWDELVAIDAASAYYDVEGFRAGRSSLDRIAVESFTEYPWCNEQLRPIFVQGDDGLWRSPPGTPALPIVYALRATKPS